MKIVKEGDNNKGTKLVEWTCQKCYDLKKQSRDNIVMDCGVISNGTIVEFQCPHCGNGIIEVHRW